MKVITRFAAAAVLTVLSATTVFGQGAPAKPEEEPAKKKNETKYTEVVATDSLPSSELMKRAVNWIKADDYTFKKTGGNTTGSKAECTIAFPVKAKELNPQVDYTGKITMKVVIECKDSKYRYTVSDIRHVSKSGNYDGGSVDNSYPECGSQTMNETIWKRLKGEALRDAANVVANLKDGMSKDSKESSKDDW
jgi:hypothetical protein